MEKMFFHEWQSGPGWWSNYRRLHSARFLRQWEYAPPGGAAGQHRGGRHLRYPDDTPHANLLLSMLEKVDVEVDALGDSTGTLARL